MGSFNEMIFLTFIQEHYFPSKYEIVVYLLQTVPLEEDYSPNWYFSTAGSTIGVFKAKHRTDRQHDNVSSSFSPIFCI